MIGMVRVSGSRLMARVAWNPLSPGITTSMRIRSGFSNFALRMASSPLSLATTSKPDLVSMSFSTCRSVGESSTMRILRIAIVLPCTFTPAISRGRSATRASFGPVLTLGRRTVDVRGDRLAEALLGKRLGQILIRPHHSAAGPVEQSIFRGQHDDGGPVEFRILLDDCAGLVPV